MSITRPFRLKADLNFEARDFLKNLGYAEHCLNIICKNTVEKDPRQQRTKTYFSTVRDRDLNQPPQNLQVDQT